MESVLEVDIAVRPSHTKIVTGRISQAPVKGVWIALKLPDFILKVRSVLLELSHFLTYEADLLMIR